MALPTAPQATIARNEPNRNPTIEGRAPGTLSDAIRNVQKYSQGESLRNEQGGGTYGPSFQFDSKGVDFGSWLRRFRAQVYRNWLIPYAAMALHGHTVIRFTIHKDGSITDLIVLQPSEIDAFTKAAFNAIKTSNPTVPLPQDYPDDRMVMTVIFYYNETPPGGGGQ
jgi:TonB family protein